MTSYVVVHKVYRLLLMFDFNKPFSKSVILVSPTVSFFETQEWSYERQWLISIAHNHYNDSIYI